MGPINYLAAAPQADFLRNIQGGLQIGQAWQQGQREAQLFEQQQAQLQAQQQAAQQYQADVSAAMANPTPAGIRALALKYPQHGKVYSELLTGLSGEQRTAALGDTASLAAALSGGRTDVASRLVDQRIEAMRTRGEQTADVEALRDAIKTNPQAAYGHALSLLAGFGEDGSKVLDTLSKARTQPLTERKAAADTSAAESDAATKAIAAKYGEQSALLDLQKKGWDIRGIEADIEFKKQSTRIAAMNAALGREGNDLKRQELQLRIEDAKRARDQAIREKAAEFESASNGVADSRGLISEIRELRSEWGFNATGVTAGASLMPGSKARTEAGKIDQLRDSLAAVNLDKLKGAMSDKDIMFLRNIASNLDRWQGDSRFESELEKIDGVLSRADAALRKKYGAPAAPKVSQPAPGAGQPTGGVTVSGW